MLRTRTMLLLQVSQNISEFIEILEMYFCLMILIKDKYIKLKISLKGDAELWYSRDRFYCALSPEKSYDQFIVKINETFLRI